LFFSSQFKLFISLTNFNAYVIENFPGVKIKEFLSKISEGTSKDFTTG